MYTDKLITSKKHFKMAAKSGFPFFWTTLYYCMMITHIIKCKNCTRSASTNQLPHKYTGVYIKKNPIIKWLRVLHRNSTNYIPLTRDYFWIQWILPNLISEMQSFKKAGWKHSGPICSIHTAFWQWMRAFTHTV